MVTMHCSTLHIHHLHRALGAVLLTFTMSGTCFADLMIDQQFDPGTSSGSQTVTAGSQFAQTFTVGLPGPICAADVLIQNAGVGTNTGSLTLSIFAFDGGASTIGAVALATQSVAAVAISGTAGFLKFTFDSAYSASVGEPLAIVLTTTDTLLQGGYNWFRSALNSGTDGYTQGAAFARSGTNLVQLGTGSTDFGFITRNPEPGILSLCGIGALAFTGYGGLRLRRKKKTNDVSICK